MKTFLSQNLAAKRGPFVTRLAAILFAVFFTEAQAANPDLLYTTPPPMELGGSAPYPTALGDLNHDGKTDFVRVANGQASVQLGLGDGTVGSPTTYPVGNQAIFLVIADMNNDTHPDLVIANINDKTVSVLLGNGYGTFQNQIVTNVALVATSIAVTDFNKDGKRDLIVTGYPGFPTEGWISTLLGNGDGTFSNLTTFQSSPRTVNSQTRDVAVGDLNGDTYPDFMVSDPRTRAFVSFLNNQDGTFRRHLEMSPPGVYGRLTLADFNSDGKLDLAYLLVSDPQFGNTGEGSNIGVAMGNGDGTFGILVNQGGAVLTMTGVTIYGAGSAADTYIDPRTNIIAADMDGDGILDLVTVADPSTGAQGLVSYVAILRGVGNGAFTFGKRATASSGSIWVSVGELNSDATLDMVVSENGASAQAYLSGVVVPAFTSGNGAGFISSRSNSFNVTASGNPAPTFSATGTLPSGVTFTSAGLLSGTPALGTEGVYSLTITASNSFGQSATQSFTLTVTREDLVVTTAVDEDNGSTNPALGTGTSLREAVNFANTLSGPQTIVFAQSLAGQTITLTIIGDTSMSGPTALSIIRDITIQGLTGNGTGITIARDPSISTLRLFLVNSGGPLTLNNLTLSNGRANLGGAVFSIFGSVNLNRCTLTGNVATQQGGAIYNATGGTVRLTNCTLSGNQATQTGGAIFNQAALFLTHVTVADSDAGVVGLTDVAGGLRCAGGSARLVNSIVARNTFQGSIPADITGSPALDAASTNNLIGTAGAHGLTNGVNGNIVGVSASQLYLGPLAANGGATRTMALLPGSRAINGGAVVAGVSSDQRGIARPQAGAPDIGAFEFDGAILESLLVTTATDELDFTSDPAFGTGTSLREALVYANARPGPDTITFAPGLAGQTIVLSRGWNDASDAAALRVASEMTLQGHTSAPGVKIAMASGVAKKHINVEGSGSLTVSHLTFTGGSGDYGGSIGNFGTLTVRHCTFTGNHANFDAGAVHSSDGSPSLLIDNSTFSGNSSAFSSSAIATGAQQTTYRHLTVTNNSGGSGAMLLYRYPATVVNSLIAGNSPDGVLDRLGAAFSATSTNNILGSGGSAGLVNGVNGNLVGVPASRLYLGVLGNNGGPTQTIALLPGSLAINTGVAIAGLTTDQRGNARGIGAAPDIGAFEDATGNDDLDGDTLANIGEYNSGTNPLAIDSDGDGFNDPTELMAPSDPNSAASIPPTTHIARVLGFGTARGLDLSGNFRYAFNVGTPGAAGVAGNANFTADNAPGITVSAPNEIAEWTIRDFGNSAADNVLETVYRSIRWGFPGQPVTADLANVVPGRRYKLQLLVGEGWGYNRVFDVLVNGALIVDDFNSGPAQGLNSNAKAASAIVYEFTASTTAVNIVLSGDNTPAGGDRNPILSGVTLEELPTAAAAPLISPASGTYESSVALSLSTTAAGATIRYTTDGSAPSATLGTIYTGPFTLTTSATVRAIATGGGWLDSTVSSASYLVLTPLQAWRARHALAADGSQDLANPSGDGIANLLKYAFNMAPNAGDLALPNIAVLPESGTAGLPFITRDAQGRLFIEFVRRKAATNPGITYIVQTGDDLTNLQPLALTGASVVSLDAVWERVTVVDPTITLKRFGRVRVQIVP